MTRIIGNRLTSDHVQSSQTSSHKKLDVVATQDTSSLPHLETVAGECCRLLEQLDDRVLRGRASALTRGGHAAKLTRDKHTIRSLLESGRRTPCGLISAPLNQVESGCGPYKARWRVWSQYG